MKLAFDGGTLRLEGAAQQLRAHRIPRVRWDSRIRAFRAPAFCYPEVCSELRRLQIPFSDQAAENWSPAPSTSPVFSLRPYQEAALACWRLAGKRGIVTLPTGSGKTLLGIGAISELKASTLILVPTRILMEQWQKEVIENIGVSAGLLGDTHRDIRPITIATFESAYRYMHSLGSRFQFMIVDEVHHFGNGIRDEALEMALAPSRLGLTATLPKDGPVLSRLAELMGPPVYELSIRELSGTFLAPFRTLCLKLDLNLDERSLYAREMGKFRKFQRSTHFSRGIATDWKTFVRFAVQTKEGREAVDAWRKARQIVLYTQAKEQAIGTILQQYDGKKILIFTANNQSAYRIAKKFLIMPITKDIRKPERSEVMEKFKRGDLRALVSCRVLNEGLDVPDADLALVVGGSLGEREHVQRVGRCLRPAPGKEAIVYELVTRATMEVSQSEKRRGALGTEFFA